MTKLNQYVIVRAMLRASMSMPASSICMMPAVRNAVLMLLSSKTSKELLTVAGKEQLADELAMAAGIQIGWAPPEDDEDEPPRKKAVLFLLLVLVPELSPFCARLPGPRAARRPLAAQPPSGHETWRPCAS